jgi:DNA-binding response OmpR family regulator
VNVLVVEDDPDLREVLADVLVAHGHHVDVAADGAAALRLMTEASEPSRPDLVVLDWMMPRMDGLEFRRRQRADPRVASIPVVLMTAASEGRVPLAAIAPDAAIRKPVALAEFLRVINDVLQQHTARVRRDPTR